MSNMIEIRGKEVSEDTIVEALQKQIGFEEALDKPKMGWITEEEVIREGKKSLLAAVEVSIKKYRQVYEASDEELITKDIKIISGDYCGLCRRFGKSFGNSGCSNCLLGNSLVDGKERTCCCEWRVCRDAWGDWPVFRPAVLKLIERLEMEREKLLKPKLRHGDYGFAECPAFDAPNKMRLFTHEQGKFKSNRSDGSLGQDDIERCFSNGYYTILGNIFDDLRNRRTAY